MKRPRISPDVQGSNPLTSTKQNPKHRLGFWRIWGGAAVDVIDAIAKRSGDRELRATAVDETGERRGGFAARAEADDLIRRRGR